MITFWLIVSVFLVISGSICYLAHEMLKDTNQYLDLEVKWVIDYEPSLNFFYTKKMESILTDKTIKHIRQLVTMEVGSSKTLKVFPFNLKVFEIQLSCFLRDNEEEFKYLLDDFKHLRINNDRLKSFIGQAEFDEHQAYIRAILTSIIKDVRKQTLQQVLRK